MKVNLIQYVGQGFPDPSREAANFLLYIKHTRLSQGPETRQEIASWPWPKVLEELESMALTIRSSWEFLDYTFEIQGVTRAFTHQFVRTRQGSYAQQTMRTVDMAGFEVTMPNKVNAGPSQAFQTWTICVETIREAYKTLIGEGIPVEDARGLLPTNIQTNIIAKFNLRTLADMAGKRQNPRAQEEYREVFQLMAIRVLSVHPWAQGFLYPDRTRTPALDQIMRISKIMAQRHPEAFAKDEIMNAQKEVDQLKGVWG